MKMEQMKKHHRETEVEERKKERKKERERENHASIPFSFQWRRSSEKW